MSMCLVNRIFIFLILCKWQVKEWQCPFSSSPFLQAHFNFCCVTITSSIFEQVILCFHSGLGFHSSCSNVLQSISQSKFNYDKNPCENFWFDFEIYFVYSFYISSSKSCSNNVNLFCLHRNILKYTASSHAKHRGQ